MTSKRSLWWHTTKCQLLHRGAGLPEIGKDHSNKEHARIMDGGISKIKLRNANCAKCIAHIHGVRDWISKLPN